MSRTWRWFCVIIGVALCAGLAPPPRIEYAFTPLIEGDALRAVQIDVRFRGDADGETSLRLPDSWGGEDDLWRGVESLTAVAGADLVAGEEPARRTLRHAPAANIHLRYRVVQDWAGEPNARRGNTYRPIVQPTYFHLIGHAALIVPDIDGATIVRIRTRDFPRRWAFVSDLQHGPVNLGRVSTSVTVGGDYRLLSAADGVRVAIRGAWSFSDREFADQVASIVAGQRRFWGDSASPFLVTVTQLSSPDPNWISVGGTGLDDAFALFATPNVAAHPMTRTLAHEAMHTWIPERIGGLAVENEAAQYWLSEGFTDFYAARLLVRDGVWGPPEFARDLNDMMAAYARSPARTEANMRIAADFWNDADVQDLPYQRGRLLAALWDARLRTSGRDFDEVVLEMQARARADRTSKALELFAQVAQAMGLAADEDVRAHIEAGAPILLPEDTFAPCGRVLTRDVREFHRGFDIEATQANSNVIAGVVADGPAYAAGMRDGMVLVRREAGEIGNSELEIAYVVRDGDVERTLRYMPHGPRTITLQSLVLDPALEGEALAQCRRVLGGG